MYVCIFVGLATITVTKFITSYILAPLQLVGLIITYHFDGEEISCQRIQMLVILNEHCAWESQSADSATAMQGASCMLTKLSLLHLTINLKFLHPASIKLAAGFRNMRTVPSPIVNPFTSV